MVSRDGALQRGDPHALARCWVCGASANHGASRRLDDDATKERERGLAMPVALDDIPSAVEFISMGASDNLAYLCRETGETPWRSAFGDEFDELPDDIHDGAKETALRAWRAENGVEAEG